MRGRHCLYDMPPPQLFYWSTLHEIRSSKTQDFSILPLEEVDLFLGSQKSFCWGSNSSFCSLILPLKEVEPTPDSLLSISASRDTSSCMFFSWGLELMDPQIYLLRYSNQGQVCGSGRSEGTYRVGKTRCWALTTRSLSSGITLGLWLGWLEWQDHLLAP